MEIGQLDRRIVLQRCTETQTDYGELIRTWSNLGTVWANVNFRGGSEGFEAEQLTANTQIIFTIRYVSYLQPKDRIYYNSKYYDILNIIELDRKCYMQLQVEFKDREATT